MVRQPTILIIDSGIGGLSIYSEIKQLLPYARYLYFFDNRGFPYGEKSEQFITDRIISIVKAILKNHVLELIILACNTATIITLSLLRKMFFCSIIGVVPAIKLAVQLTNSGLIGLLATQLTVRHQYVLKLINKYACGCNFLFLGSSKLVKIAEDKKYGKMVKSSVLREILSPWLKLFQLPDTIILGCTHFVFLKYELKKLFPEGTQLVDSSKSIVGCVAQLMSNYINVGHFEVMRKNVIYFSLMTDRVRDFMPFLFSYGFCYLRIISI
ncbi:glutamate racemase [Blochmannia endosymbiont of Colobopsis nipponica]|uniref:glutamate racemase n=1 Tax=Blochmannia endosymbiont of Colobopsis nipponica TaxID=2681987 RepID=UPI001CE365D1|nr:glutamate racemase [Blochmannia endosymbiont of Colobopsis nipponica]